MDEVEVVPDLAFGFGEGIQLLIMIIGENVDYFKGFAVTIIYADFLKDIWYYKVTWSVGSLWDIALLAAITVRVLLLIVTMAGGLLLPLLLLLVLLPLLLFLTSKLLLLFFQVELENQALDSVLVLTLILHFSGSWVRAGSFLLLKGDILDDVTIDVLIYSESVEETFFLVDFNDGEILTVLSTSKEACIDNVLHIPQTKLNEWNQCSGDSNYEL